MTRESPCRLAAGATPQAIPVNGGGQQLFEIPRPTRKPRMKGGTNGAGGFRAEPHSPLPIVTRRLLDLWGGP